MSFRIRGLDPSSFHDLFTASQTELAERGALRSVVDAKPGFPDRVELRDCEVGETVVLVNYVHQPANTPYRASHAIYVGAGSATAYDRTDEVPQSLRDRCLSLRAFDERHMIVIADLTDGLDVERAIERMFERNDVAYIHAHYAKPGCYAARIDRI